MPQQHAARGFARPTLNGTLSSQKRGAYGYHKDAVLSQATNWAFPDACEAFTGKITGLHLLLLDPPSGCCLGADTAGTASPRRCPGLQKEAPMRAFSGGDILSFDGDKPGSVGVEIVITALRYGHETTRGGFAFAKNHSTTDGDGRPISAHLRRTKKKKRNFTMHVLGLCRSPTCSRSQPA
jgi:hypothetical protein